MNRRHEILSLIVLGLFVFAPTFASAAVPAFPGAQGGGAASVGGRGGAVIEVTNLKDSGAGSLRACVLASGPRTCVFRVGGTINLLSRFYITKPYLTVAGQTAPGDGILLSGKNSSENMVMIATHDVIFRYIRVRKGDNSGCTDECGANIVMYSDSYNVVIDHVSSTWNQDENIGGWSAATSIHDVTISWNLVAEGIRSTEEFHSTGYITGGSAAGAGGMINIDWHHNLTMNNSHRNPLAKNRSSRIVNNLTYNNQFYATQLGGGISADIIGNKYKKGPLNANKAWHEIQAYNCCNGSTASGPPSMYLSGNIGWNQTNPAADQWLMARTVGGENGSEGAAIAGAWRRVTRLANTTHPIIAEPVAYIEGSILPIVGASRRLDCNGKWVANRDSVDTRLVSQYTNNTGTSVLHPSEAGYGGYPSIAGGTPCTDTDHDGMPDAWETARGLNINNAADRNTVAGSGYTNLEVYLAGTGATTTPPASGDTTSPTVSITAPVQGSTVSGSAVTVSANASDNVGVASLGFRVDGTTFFTDTSSPYAMIWNTTTATNAPHTLTALARDAAGNSTTSAGVSVTVNNAGPSCTQTTLNVSTATSDGGFAYIVHGSFRTPADNSDNPTRSVLKLFENSLALGPAHSAHANIRNLGQGRFSHWSLTTGAGESLRFAASNNTNPRTNGRSYKYCVP